MRAVWLVNFVSAPAVTVLKGLRSRLYLVCFWWQLLLIELLWRMDLFSSFSYWFGGHCPGDHGLIMGWSLSRWSWVVQVILGWSLSGWSWVDHGLITVQVILGCPGDPGLITVRVILGCPGDLGLITVRVILGWSLSGWSWVVQVILGWSLSGWSWVVQVILGWSLSGWSWVSQLSSCCWAVIGAKILCGQMPLSTQAHTRPHRVFSHYLTLSEGKSQKRTLIVELDFS